MYIGIFTVVYNISLESMQSNIMSMIALRNAESGARTPAFSELSQL